MTLQISIEFLLYMSLASIGLLFSILIVSGGLSRIIYAVNYYEIEKFVGVINSYNGQQGGLISVYLPRGLCNATYEGHYVHTEYGTFYLADRIVISKKTACDFGINAKLMIEYNETTGAMQVI